MADTYEVKPGQGSVWPNDRKTEDWHADWRGKILLPDGSEHYIDLWDNEKGGKTWRGIKIGNPVAGANTGTQAPVQNNKPTSESINELEDDLPF